MNFLSALSSRGSKLYGLDLKAMPYKNYKGYTAVPGNKASQPCRRETPGMEQNNSLILETERKYTSLLAIRIEQNGNYQAEALLQNE
jgi:hypothetical protein